MDFDSKFSRRELVKWGLISTAATTLAPSALAQNLGPGNRLIARVERLSSWARKLGVLTSGIVISAAAYAHHSSDPHFDHDNPMTIEGTVTDMQFVNPHGYIYFDVTTDSGEVVPWRCELSAATSLSRRGWSDQTMLPGQHIVVNGSPARREDNVCFLSSFRLDGGPELSRGERLDAVGTTSIAALSSEAPRPERLDNGQPNLTGPWVSLSFGMGGRGFREPYEPTRAGLAARVGYEMAFDDPILRCHIVNVINGWNHDRHVNDIYQSGSQVTLQYGFMDFVRTIHLGMTRHPVDIVPSTGGHSIGRWEDGVLVVDTIGFEQGVLGHRDGTSHSDKMHLVEKFWIDTDENVLIRDYTMEDQSFLAQIVNGQDVMALSAAPYEPYGCVELSGENNIRPE